MTDVDPIFPPDIPLIIDTYIHRRYDFSDQFARRHSQRLQYWCGYADMRKSKYMAKIFRVVPSKLKLCCPALSKPLPRSQIHFSRFPRLPYSPHLFLPQTFSTNTFIQRDANACHPEIRGRKYTSLRNIK